MNFTLISRHFSHGFVSPYSKAAPLAPFCSYFELDKLELDWSRILLEN